MNGNKDQKLNRFKKIGISLFAVALIGGGIGYASYVNNTPETSDQKISATGDSTKKSSVIEKSKGKNKGNKVIDDIKKEAKDKVLDILTPGTITNAIGDLPNAKVQKLDRSAIKKEMAKIDAEIEQRNHKKSEVKDVLLSQPNREKGNQQLSLSADSVKKPTKDTSLDDSTNKGSKDGEQSNVIPIPTPTPNPKPEPKPDPTPDPEPKPDVNIPELIDKSRAELTTAKQKAEGLTDRLKAIQDELAQLSSIEETTSDKVVEADNQWDTIESLVSEYQEIANELHGLLETDGTVTEANQEIYQTTYAKLSNKVKELQEAQEKANSSTKQMNENVSKAQATLNTLEKTKIEYQDIKQEKTAINNETNTAVNTAKKHNEVAEAVQPEMNQAVDANEKLNTANNVVNTQINSVNKEESQQAINNAKDAVNVVNNQAATQNEAANAAVEDFAKYPVPGVSQNKPEVPVTLEAPVKVSVVDTSTTPLQQPVQTDQLANQPVGEKKTVENVQTGTENNETAASNIGAQSSTSTPKE